MGLLLGIVLCLLGGAAMWAGITGNEESLLSMFGLVRVVSGTGSVDPNSPNIVGPDGTPRGGLGKRVGGAIAGSLPPTSPAPGGGPGRRTPHGS